MTEFRRFQYLHRGKGGFQDAPCPSLGRNRAIGQPYSDGSGSTDLSLIRPYSLYCACRVFRKHAHVSTRANTRILTELIVPVHREPRRALESDSSAQLIQPRPRTFPRNRNGSPITTEYIPGGARGSFRRMSAPTMDAPSSPTSSPSPGPAETPPESST